MPSFVARPVERSTATGGAAEGGPPEAAEGPSGDAVPGRATDGSQATASGAPGPPSSKRLPYTAK